MAAAVAMGLLALSGCAVEEAAHGPVGDWGDEEKYPEIGGAFHTLAPVTVPPTFSSGTLTITSNVSEVISVGRRAVDSAILVNGVHYGGATATTMKRLVITGGANDQTVILDFLGGIFGAGTATSRGIDVNLGAGNGDSLSVRGGSTPDTIAVGSDGIATNADNYRDIDVNWASLEGVNFALVGGNDTFKATAAGKGVSGSASVALTVFGGAGNDTITGGSGNDALFGGAGNDTLEGAFGDDVLSGDTGLDTISQGADKDGNDAIHCGTEDVLDPLKPVLDVVSYAHRGTSAARNETSLQTVRDSDGGRVRVSIGGPCVDGDTNGVCDLDAFGLKQYPADDGQIVESGGTFVNGVMTVATTIAADETDAVAPDCEHVLGGMDNDILIGDTGVNTLSGAGGNDILRGGGGDDILNGGADNDTFDESTVSLGAGGDTFNGGVGIDTVDYSARSNPLTITMDGKSADDGESNERDTVKADVENVVGGLVGDDITGNSLGNRLAGGAGADVLDGAVGDDVFDEGAGTNGGDVFIGGAGADTVDYGARTGNLTVTMDGVDADDGEFNEGDQVTEDVENVIGGGGVDSLTGNVLNNVIRGGAGLDTLLAGGEGDDTIDGEADYAASIQCGAGSDLAFGLNAGVMRDVACELW